MFEILNLDAALPDSQQTKELPERMAAVGMPQVAIDLIENDLEILEEMDKASPGSVAVLRAAMKRNLADVDLGAPGFFLVEIVRDN
jgi:hypothetical protein